LCDKNKEEKLLVSVCVPLL